MKIIFIVAAAMVQGLGFHPSKVEVGVRVTVAASISSFLVLKAFGQRYREEYVK